MVRRLEIALVIFLAGAPAFSQNSNEPGFEGVHVAPPVQPGVHSNTPAAVQTQQDDWATLEGMVARILQLQRQCLVGIDAYHAATDELGKNRALGDVKIGNASVEGMLLSSTWQEIVEKVRKTQDVNTTKDVRYLSTFGPGGHLVVIDKTQEAIRAFLREPAPPGARPISTPASGSGTNVAGTPARSAPPETLESVNNKIDEIGRELARTDLTPEKRRELEAERTRLVGRIAELAKGPAIVQASPAPSASPIPYGNDGLNPPAGAGPAAGASPAPTAPGSGAAAGRVMLVPNSYGVAPLVMTDAEIRVALDPLIDKQLGHENAKITGGGQMNKYRQLIGKTKSATLTSVGKPDYDHYREWLTASPELKKAINDHAQGIYNQKAQAAGVAAVPSIAPPPPPDPTARAGGATAPANAPAASGAATPGHAAPAAPPLPALKLDAPPSK